MISLHQKTLALLERIAAGETVLDGGSAKCKPLDRRTLESLAQQIGGMTQVRAWSKQMGAGLNFMEAQWVATDAALYYIAYHPGVGYRWPWNILRAVVPGKRGRLLPTQRVIVETRKERLVWSLGRLAGESLLRISNQHISR